MKTGLTLTELARKIEANQKTKHDFIAPTDRIEMQAVGGNVVALSADDGRGSKSLNILPLAHQQIAAYTGIPRDYYDRMLNGRTGFDRNRTVKVIEAPRPSLLASNVNTWFKANPRRRMIRTLATGARAFLSDRYQRIENEEIAEAALPVLADLPGVQIVSSEVTDQRLYIHFVVPTIEGEVKVGDVVQAGGIISNSEVGLGSVSVSGLLWRLICLNGAKTTDAFRRNHVGRKIEDNDALWADDTRQADDKAVLLKVRDMVRAVVDETRFRVQLGKLQGLTEGKIEGDPTKAIEVLAKKVGATEAEKGGILRSLIEGGDLSRWGIMNAVTAQAHKATSYDRAVEFEAMGGHLIELPRNDWQEVLLAA